MGLDRDGWDRLKDMMRATVRKELRDIRRKADGVVARAVLRSLGSSSGMGVAGIDLRDGDSPDEVEHFEAYGFTSAPLAGAEGVGLTVGGDSSHRLLVCVGDRRHRPKDLAVGEVAVYRNAAGHRFVLKADGSTEITTPVEGQSIVMKANGDVIVTPGAGAGLYLGEAGASKKVALAEDVDARINTLRTTFNAHTHPTAPPGVVSIPTPVPGVIPVPAQATTGAANVYGKG